MSRTRWKLNSYRSSPATYIIAYPCADVLDKGCIEECPVDCIYEGHRTSLNAQFFTNPGSPGSASKVGKTGRDRPLVAALPQAAEK
jgi:ferredoxin